MRGLSTNNSGAVWTPLDTDTNGSPDYVEGWARLVFTNAIGLRVDVENSTECGGTNAQRQIKEATVLLTAQIQISANVTNHIKIAIEDVGDKFLDSAIFIKAWSPCD